MHVYFPCDLRQTDCVNPDMLYSDIEASSRLPTATCEALRFENGACGHFLACAQEEDVICGAADVGIDAAQQETASSRAAPTSPLFPFRCVTAAIPSRRVSVSECHCAL